MPISQKIVVGIKIVLNRILENALSAKTKKD